MPNEVPDILTDIDQRISARFDRRYKLLELKERRSDRAVRLEELAINRDLKSRELNANEGRGIRFTSSQATVAAAVIALLSGLIGGFIQGGASAWVEQIKSNSSYDIERLKSQAEIDLEKQKQSAAESLERKKFETTLILKATSAAKRDEQIRNLKFFLNAGFISDPENKLAGISEKDYPSDTAAVRNTGVSVDSNILVD